MTVVDASVWVSRLVPQDVNHAGSRDWLDSYANNGGLLVAPVLLLAEVAGAVSRRTGDQLLARRVVQQLLRVPGLRLVAVDRRLGEAAARVAADRSLRGADAVYIATARRLSVSLVTWDREQRERAGGLVVVRTPQEMYRGV